MKVVCSHSSVSNRCFHSVPIGWSKMDAIKTTLFLSLKQITAIVQVPLFKAVIWFPYCLLVWRADLRFMCATVSGTLLITWTTAGMKRMLQHLQQAVNKGSISKVAWIIIYLPSLKIFHHNFPLPSSLLKIRKKHHFPKTLFCHKLFCHKKCNKPCDFVENTGNLANDLGVCQWCAIRFEHVRPNSEPFRTWWTRRAGFFPSDHGKLGV